MLSIQNPSFLKAYILNSSISEVVIYSKAFTSKTFSFKAFNYTAVNTRLHLALEQNIVPFEERPQKKDYMGRGRSFKFFSPPPTFVWKTCPSPDSFFWVGVVLRAAIYFCSSANCKLE